MLGYYTKFQQQKIFQEKTLFQLVKKIADDCKDLTERSSVDTKEISSRRSS